MSAWSIDVGMVKAWLEGLDKGSYEQVIAALELLAEVGPRLGRPLVDTVQGSRHATRGRWEVMATSLEEMLDERPVDRAAVEAHKRRMLEEVRSYRLRELREALSLTQVELAARLSVSQNRVSQIELGGIERAQVDTLRRYVEAVGGRLRIEVELGDDRIQIG